MREARQQKVKFYVKQRQIRKMVVGLCKKLFLGQFCTKQEKAVAAWCYMVRSPACRIMQSMPTHHVPKCGL